MKKVIIIGGGLSGLSSGIYLNSHGFETLILEKNANLGGFATTWKRKGSIIDGCMHWMLGTKEGTKMNSIWKNLGLPMDEIINPNTFCTIEYEKNIFHYYRDIDKLEEEFYRFSMEDEEEIKIFMNAVRTIGVMEIPTEIPYELASKEDFKMDMSIMRAMKYYLKLTIGEVASRFHSPVIQYALKNCLVNENFSAFYFIQTISNFCMGNDSIPKGCTKTIVDSMVKKYESLGGKYILNTNVDEIILEDGAAKGVKALGIVYPADYVICACDLHYVKNVLLKNTYKLEPIEEYDANKSLYPTYSYIIASYRTKHKFTDEEIAYIKKIKPYDFMGICGDCLSVRQYGYDDTLVTDGYSTVQVYITTYEKEYEIIKSLNKEDYKKLKSSIGAYFIPYLEEVYQDSFELLDVLTPLTYERYNHSYKGTFMTYALKARVPQYFRSAMVDSIDNLFLANQWLLLPGGTPIAVVSGKYACQLILYKEGINYII